MINISRFKNRGYISIEMIIIAALIMCFGGLAVKNLVFGGSDVQDKETTAFVDTTKAVYEAVGHIPPPNIGGVGGGNLSNKGLKPNDIITIEGRKYVVLADRNNNRYLVMDIDGIGHLRFNHDNNGQDPHKCTVDVGNTVPGRCNNQYENSDVDEYLNTTYFNNLSQKIKEAIIETNIQQHFYKHTVDSHNNYEWFSPTNQNAPNGCRDNWCVKQSDGTWLTWDKHNPIKGQHGASKLLNSSSTTREDGYQSNIIKRKIFLPSIDEVSLIANINDEYDIHYLLKGCSDNKFLNAWLRDSSVEIARPLFIHIPIRSLSEYLGTNNYADVRPTFVVDLNKIDFTKENKVLIPPYSPEQNQVKYEVHHYWQNITDDNYTLHEKMVYRGNPNTKVVTEQLKKEYEGFNYKNAKVNNNAVTETVIKSDGTTVINVYYDRKMIYLDLNGLLDGVWTSGISLYGLVSVKINDVTISTDAFDFYKAYKYGSTYEVFDIKTIPGHIYVGPVNSTLKGTLEGEMKYHEDKPYKEVLLEYKR